MNAAHVHLVVNHVPILGALFSVPILALAMWLRGNSGLTLAAATLLAIGLAGAGLASWSGDGAAEIVERIPGVRKADIETHEGRADTAIVFVVVAALGAATAAALEWRRKSPLPRAAIAVVLALAIAASAAMAWAGLAGGRIRHTEIRMAVTPEQPG